MGKENLHVLMEVFVVNYYASQQIYDALGDSDGVAGVAAIRVSEPSLHEQILQYESTGNTDNMLLLCVWASCFSHQVHSTMLLTAILKLYNKIEQHLTFMRCNTLVSY